MKATKRLRPESNRRIAGYWSPTWCPSQVGSGCVNFNIFLIFKIADEIFVYFDRLCDFFIGERMQRLKENIATQT